MSERAQVVLLAAVIVAVAMVPIVAAHAQLGYQGDVRAATERAGGDRVAASERLVARGLANASADVPATYPWANRTEAAFAVREALARDLRSLRDSRVAPVVDVEYNASYAERAADRRCPDGPGRTFGPCVATAGLVVQERQNATHVLGAALDLRLLATGESVDVTLFVEPR